MMVNKATGIECSCKHNPKSDPIFTPNGPCCALLNIMPYLHLILPGFGMMLSKELLMILCKPPYFGIALVSSTSNCLDFIVAREFLDLVQ